MDGTLFETVDGRSVPAVTADEMREIDRVAVEDVGIDLLVMMENAGRNLAAHARAMAAASGSPADGGPVTVVAGNGGNGGGGLACARHLVNRGVSVSVILDRPPADFDGVAARQHRILDAMDVPVAVGPDAFPTAPGLVVDALVGYGLAGPLRGTAADLVSAVASADAPTLSLDVPSGRDATGGEEPGVAVAPDSVLTLALPKTGLAGGDFALWLADISVPAVVYDRLDLSHESPFADRYRVELADAE